MTSSGIEPATFRLVVQCLKQLRNWVLADKVAKFVLLQTASFRIVGAFYHKF